MIELPPPYCYLHLDTSAEKWTVHDEPGPMRVAVWTKHLIESVAQGGIPNGWTIREEHGALLVGSPIGGPGSKWMALEDRGTLERRLLIALAQTLMTPTPATGSGGEELARIGELIRTQDNRITDQPQFAVQQKRRIFGIDEDFEEGHMWYDPQAVESYDDAGKDERDAERAAEGSSPIKWQRGGYIDVWEFVTACFTEQGCKDYLARDGHNLREPRIYAYGSYRNTEWQTVRNFLKAHPAPAGGCAE